MPDSRLSSQRRRRHLHLNINILSAGIFGGSWRFPGHPPHSSYTDDHYLRIARTALDADGEQYLVTVPTDRSGVTLLDDFDAIGQRLTASGTTVLDAVPVAPGEYLRSPPIAENRGVGAPFAQLYLAAVAAGIAAAALDDARWFANEVARPIKHSTAQRSVDDPYVREAAGEISRHAFAARAVVLLAAEDLDAAAQECGDRRESALVRATVAVAEAQVTAMEAALSAGTTLFDLGGGTATLRDYNLDRHWRNARTVANHNPTRWKAAVIGAFRLVDIPPPNNGLF